MPPRPPTIREKRRYLLIRLLPAGMGMDPKLLHRSINEGTTSLFGDEGAAEIGASVVYCEPGFAVIRCRRGTEKRLLLALATVNRMGEQPVSLRSILISGTIRTLRDRITRIGADLGVREYHMIEGERLLCLRSGEKIDVIEKGFKSRELLFLTHRDIEE
jgi:ribonuclease P/MRP protein subunit POP5